MSAEFGCIKSVHVINGRNQTIVSSEFCCFVSKASSVSSLGSKEDGKASVATHEGLECFRTTSCDCYCGCCFNCYFCCRGSFDWSRCSVSNQFKFNDFNRACLGCFENHIAVFSAKVSNHGRATFISIELAVSTNCSEDL